MLATFKSISLSHKTAAVEVREQIFLTENQCKLVLQEIQSVLGLEEALVLSTCNRTEVYYCAESDRSAEIIRLIGICKGLTVPCTWIKYFTVENDHLAATRQLFEVSLGLQSQLIGDLQIANQVKNAYSWASEYKLAGPFLHRLMHTVFHASKRLQQETAFRDGAASVSYATAELAAELAEMYTLPSVLVIGAGTMGADVLRNLRKGIFGRIAISNRTLSKAVELATETGVEVINFEDLENHLPNFNVIVSSVSVEKPFLTTGHFAKKQELLNHYLIDLSVPRSIDPALDLIPGVILFDIDEIQNRTEETIARRKAAIPQVLQIIEEELAGFGNWSRDFAISPTIQKLKEALDNIRKEEMARYMKNASEKEADLLEQATRSMMNKIIKLPVLQLKAACKRGEEETLIGLLNDLFNLEKTTVPNEE